MAALGACLLMLFVTPWACAGERSFHQVTGPCDFEFPRDHGPHPGFQTEWWYYTGNLQSGDGRSYGFQLTFFRRQIDPPGSERSWPQPHSAWRTQQIYLAHAALSDIASNRFSHAERIARGAVGLAGARQEGGVTTVFLHDWSTLIETKRHILRARTGEFAMDLSLEPMKEPVAHGDSGYSAKGETPERASCYYSLTRLGAEGVLTVAGAGIPVRGTAWMDHEISSSPLADDIVGWDWISLQLSNNTELMIYMLRKDDGTYSRATSGTFVDPRGKPIHLREEDFHVEVLDNWQSPRSRALYPSRWRVVVASKGLTLNIRPKMEDQELETPTSTRVTYWEGSVSAVGSIGDQPISGSGYVELTGYAGPVRGLK